MQLQESVEGAANTLLGGDKEDLLEQSEEESSSLLNHNMATVQENQVDTLTAPPEQPSLINLDYPNPQQIYA